MTARKPKPRKAAPRKASKPTPEVRLETAEAFMGAHSEAINQLHQRVAGLEAEMFPERYNGISGIRALSARVAILETRKQFRDASHDEPVSNAGEAVGQHFRIVGEVPRWWQFWRRG